MQYSTPDTWFIDGAEQFFDLRSDPQEWKDLASVPAYATKIAESRSHLIEELGVLSKVSPTGNASARVEIMRQCQRLINSEKRTSFPRRNELKISKTTK